MSEGDLEKIHDEELRRIALARFKDRQSPLFCDSQTKHFLPRPIDALTLCGAKRFKTKRQTREMWAQDFPEWCGEFRLCEQCVDVIEETLK